LFGIAAGFYEEKFATHSDCDSASQAHDIERLGQYRKDALVMDDTVKKVEKFKNEAAIDDRPDRVADFMPLHPILFRPEVGAIQRSGIFKLDR
jgi:hypothetical protein